MSKFNLNFLEVITSLSNALDLVSIHRVNHGKRVASMALACGKAMHWEMKRLDDLFLAAILHDCGISKTNIFSRLTHFEVKNIDNHCVKGSELLQRAPLLANLSDYILHHHTSWAELIGLDLPDAVKIIANCIYLHDRVDILTLTALETGSANILASRESIRKKIWAKRDNWFHPELVDHFLALSEPEAYWLALENMSSKNHCPPPIAHNSVQEIDFQDLKQIVLIFSHIVDAKCTYTLKHSDGVANLARCLGELFKRSEHNCDKLEIAGLLHDLGKLRIPDNILEKADQLTASEFFLIQRHSYDTDKILQNISGFEDIARWAGQHHECVDGSGYPYRCSAEQLSLEAKIITVADVFQALTQNRPYRDKISLQDILQLLKKQVAEGKLDMEVVGMVENNPMQCWNAANCLSPAAHALEVLA